MYTVAEAIGTEARAVYNYASTHGDFGLMKGVSCFAPFINLMRHPLWGRVQVCKQFSLVVSLMNSNGQQMSFMLTGYRILILTSVINIHFNSTTAIQQSCSLGNRLRLNLFFAT